MCIFANIIVRVRKEKGEEKGREERRKKIRRERVGIASSQTGLYFSSNSLPFLAWIHIQFIFISFSVTKCKQKINCIYLKQIQHCKSTILQYFFFLETVS